MTAIGGRLGDPAKWAAYDAKLAKLQAEWDSRPHTPLTEAHRQRLHEQAETDERAAYDKALARNRERGIEDHVPSFRRGDRAPVVEAIHASEVTAKRVRWLWDQRLALGSLALLGGREGTGKSTLTAQLIADITRGRMEGEFDGSSRGVIVVATEDSMAETIVPRLMAARADLTRVYRAEAVTADGILTGLSLPYDIGRLEEVIRANEVALVVLDPLMSRLDSALDTHKDAEVRQALEPLVALATRARVTILGLIHVNKSTTTDPLTSLMASRAFPAVARGVLFVTPEADDPEVRAVGQVKNNLGPTNLPTLRFTVEGVEVGNDPEDGKPIIAGRVVWQASSTQSVSDILQTIMNGPKGKSKRAEAEEWLVAYLQVCEDGRAEATEVQVAASRAGIGKDPLRRAREKVVGEPVREGWPAKVYWQLPTRLMGHVQD